MKTKACSNPKCKKEYPATTEFFYKQKDKLSSRCKVCVNKQKKQYYKENKDSILAYNKQYYLDNQEKKIQYRFDHYWENREDILEYKKGYHLKHYPENKAKYIAKDIKRRKRKESQLPDYANISLMNRIYKECPEGFHVDHMTPLAAGGLHHESNLCYLPAEVNLSKGTKTIDEFGQEQFSQHVIYWQDVLACTNNSLTETI